LIEINLLPEDMRKKEGFSLALPDLPIGRTIVLAFAFLFIAQFALLAFAIFQASRVGPMSTEIEQLKAQSKEILRQKSEIAAMDSRLKDIDALTARRVYWARLLNAISNSATKGVWLTGLAVVDAQETVQAPPKPGQKPGAPTLRRYRYLKLDGSVVGQGQETAYIGKFIKELKGNPVLSDLFMDVKLASITQKKIRDLDVYDFVLTCQFKEGVS